MTEFIIKYWLQVLFGLITTVMAFVMRKMNKKIAEQEAIRMGVQALLRDRIIEKYDRAIQDGYCPIHIRDSILEMAKQYYNLGGNGVVNNLVDKIQYLPTTLEIDEE
jgi:hypothetical protein